MNEENKTHVKDVLHFLLKVLIFILVLALVFAIGLMLGYSIIGNGGNPLNVFDPNMWGNILNFFLP